MSDTPSFGTNMSLIMELEALLFVTPDPVTVNQLAKFLDASAQDIEKGLQELSTLLETRGVRLQRHRDRVQMTSAPELAPLVERFLDLETTSRLSLAALETLSIVAYKQPITRPQIDSIRGVNSDGVLRGLLSKGLIQDLGRAESPGRPYLYGTTPDFLGYFGLTSLQELPPLKEEEEEIEEETDIESRIEDFKDLKTAG